MQSKTLRMHFRKTQPVRLRALVVMITVLLGVGCSPTPKGIPSETMLKQTPQLSGNWEKIAGSQCSQIYPDRIEFQERGLYFGHKDPPGTFTWWDVGTYEIVSPTQVKISTANDAIITYDFSIVDDVLTFVDPDKCEFKYRKVR
jgi:hypothetical protein